MFNRGTRATLETSGASRWRLLEVEDLLLAAWVAAADSVARRSYFSPERLLEEPGGRLPGTVWIVALLCLFLLFTRGVEDTDRDVALTRRVWMVGPLLPFLSLYAMAAGAVAASWLKWRPTTASGEPAWPAPLFSRLWRRTAAVPVMILGDILFHAEFQEADIARPFDYTGGSFLLALGIIAPYVLFVVGPRIVAGATMSPWVWAGRLAVFVAASWWAATDR